ncbi:hypothetical protein AQS8620_02304 [Aquimixticola soesokkakensis]|uniref:Uncharacterized protein n=1 Tax=Aquimixticola soesokkakensis TaxID=1519096 RepID=A0A1Y5T550_9RHOB|nr:hypothetical protein AQS8620_02304 [Aquimixticola soesokkakensis]
MPNEWIIDVLTDLRAFAEKNGLPATADQLDDARLIVATELANVAADLSQRANRNDAPNRELTRLHSGCGNA